MENTSITVDQMLSIIGSKEVELLICKNKIMELNAKLEQLEKTKVEEKSE